MNRPKVVLLGALTTIPVGGVVWLMVHYMEGFRRIGFDPYYVEAHARTPSAFMDDPYDDGTVKACAYIDQQLRRFGFGDRWAFHALHDDGRCYGLSERELDQLYADAALIINMHGGTVPLEEHARTGRLVYLGTDPVDVELEVERGERATIDYLEPHVAFFTWGLNYGNPDCGLPWHAQYSFVPSPPPVVVELWHDGDVPIGPNLTTIGNWRQQYRDIEFNGQRYTWSKHHEFAKVLDLPARVGERFELALSSFDDNDQRHLEAHGWRVRRALDVAGTTEQYRRYIQASQGEFSVAKEQNVHFRSGWFSERSAMYLAAGRPVILQDTGFGNHLPLGSGLFAFTDIDSAAACVDDLVGNYRRHSAAARQVAAEFLDAERVLTRMVEHVGVAPTTR